MRLELFTCRMSVDLVDHTGQHGVLRGLVAREHTRWK